MSELKKSGWKYGLIKVSINNEGTEFEDQTNHIVELYPDKNQNYTSFCNSRLMSAEELEFALNDIKEDGINEYFFDNGKFTWDTCNTCHTSELDWEPSNRSMGSTIIKENKQGEPYINLTSDTLLQMGWAEGDDIGLDCNADGTFTLTKIDQKMTVHQWKGKDNDDNEELYAIYGGD